MSSAAIKLISFIFQVFFFPVYHFFFTRYSVSETNDILIALFQSRVVISCAKMEM